MSNKHPAAFCPHHGIVPVPWIDLSEPGIKVEMLGFSVDCPVCGQQSEILPGTYSDVDGRINLLLHPSISPEALQAIKEIAERLQRGEVSVAEAEKQIADRAPALRGLFANLKQETVASIAAAVIMSVGAAIAARSGSPSSTTINNYYAAAPPTVSQLVTAAIPQPLLPIVGPVPEPKPKQLNRHARRKQNKLDKSR